MLIRELEVKEMQGVKSANAQKIVARAMRFNSDIFFEKGNQKANAKSLMSVLALNLSCGDKIMVVIRGDDQEEALKELENWI